MKIMQQEKKFVFCIDKTVLKSQNCRTVQYRECMTTATMLDAINTTIISAAIRIASTNIRGKLRRTRALYLPQVFQKIRLLLMPLL
jgi:hypothetical protein